MSHLTILFTIGQGKSIILVYHKFETFLSSVLTGENLSKSGVGMGQTDKREVSTGQRKMTTMNWLSLFSIGVGAMLGAWLRWALGLWLNPLFPTMPLGTLAANLLGGYLVGAAVTVFHLNLDLSPELRLFFITGVLGALTTFSTFSAEVVALIQRAEYGWAAGTASLHLLGSLVMTGLGILTIQKLAQ